MSWDIQFGGAQVIHYGVHASPFGDCLVGVAQERLAYMGFEDNPKKLEYIFNQAHCIHNSSTTEPFVERVLGCLYAKHVRIPLLFQGTDFQCRVWTALLSIHTGTVSSYKAIAQGIGHLNAARAVGGAVGANRIAIVVPCHRVLASNGKLGGFAYGVALKQRLLQAESS